ncbi:MAG: hypothetical protein V7645_2117 [Actinomycetota bacterium]|jgi:hypothetical protein
MTRSPLDDAVGHPTVSYRSDYVIEEVRHALLEQLRGHLRRTRASCCQRQMPVAGMQEPEEIGLLDDGSPEAQAAPKLSLAHRGGLAGLSGADHRQLRMPS